MACDLSDCGAEGTVEASPGQKVLSQGKRVRLGVEDWGKDVPWVSSFPAFCLCFLAVEAGGGKHGCTCSDPV